MATLTCHDVADYFLAQFDNDSGELITNLKLQKLVYYAQGVSLGLTGQPLFEEKIEAWEHGPVVPELYQRFKDFGRNALPTMQLDINRYTPELLNLLAAVFACFIHYPAWDLRNMTHDEAPWKSVYMSERNHEITQSSLKKHFSQTAPEPHYMRDIRHHLLAITPFNFDLARMQERVSGETVAVPTLEANHFEQWSQQFDQWRESRQA